MIYALSALTLINLIIYKNLNKISNIVKLNDYPDHKLKKHKKIIPLLGGSIFLLNVFFLNIFDFFYPSSFFNIFLDNSRQLAFLLILFLIFILGFWDDKYNLNPNKKFFLLIFITTIFVFLDKNIIIQKFSLSFVENKIFLENYSIIFSIFCIILLINALNFYDGVNCQSVIFFMITFIYLLFISKRYEFYFLILFILIFLFYLNYKNKLFLGDNGVYVLGITLSMSLMYEHNIHKNIVFADEIFLLLILPGYDLLRLSIIRIYKKSNPFKGDRNHIQHLLINKYSLIKTNLVLLLLGSSPIILFKIFKINFFIVLAIFLIIYSLMINKLNSHN